MAKKKDEIMALAMMDWEQDQSLCFDPKTNTYNATELAEYLAHNYGSSRWLDDDRHWIWKLAADLCEEWEEYDPQSADESEGEKWEYNP